MNLLEVVPSRRGHFLLESGYHSDTWLTLDALFTEPSRIAPLVSRLADRLRQHDIQGVCGPLLGGAFLAQAIATRLGISFYYAELEEKRSKNALFTADYRLPRALQREVRGRRIAVVDDVISAGSSVRATMASVEAADASTRVVGSLVVLGLSSLEFFAEQDITLETLQRASLDLWPPAECPLCGRGEALEDPRESA